MTTDTSTDRSTVGPVARALGFAGLLPQLATVLVLVWASVNEGWDARFMSGGATLIAFAYGGVILSFLGGMWWSMAMRRTVAQGRLAVLAVVPSLVAMGLVPVAGVADMTWALVLLGSAILLTLPVDRHLAATGEAPEGWMTLRIPLSVGLGVLTIAAGVLSIR